MKNTKITNIFRQKARGQASSTINDLAMLSFFCIVALVGEGLSHASQRQRLTDAEVVAQLQVQLRLLGGSEESWSATLTAWRGRPMKSLESHQLASLLGLDLDRRVWRDGRWRPLEMQEAVEDSASGPRNETDQ